MEKLGHGKSEFVDGVRITGREDVKVVEMVLTGKINTELVSLLNQSSAHAVGRLGQGRGAAPRAKARGRGRARPRAWSARSRSVNHELLEMLLDKKYVPVVSPVGLGDDGEGYNINADAAAAEIAVALRAEKLIYLTDVPGILENGRARQRDQRRASSQAKIAGGRHQGRDGGEGRRASSGPSRAGSRACTSSTGARRTRSSPSSSRIAA